MTKLLHWCAGVDTLLITKASPQDRGRYAMLGVFILFTAALSGLSMYFMSGHLMSSPLHCTLAACLWGLFIFSIDRYLAISITSFKAYLHPEEAKAKKEYFLSIKQLENPPHLHSEEFLSEKAPPGYLFATASRLIAAVFLSIVISIPVKLSLFEREITGLLNHENQTQTSGFFSSDPQINALKEERKNIAIQLKELRNEIHSTRDNMDIRYQQMKDEVDGKGSSKKPGFGRYYEQTKAAYDQARAVWLSTKVRNEPLIAQLSQRDQEAVKAISAQTKTAESNSKIDDGLLNRYSALTTLAEKNEQISLSLWLISALFIFIEAFPVMTKASPKRDSYELLLARMSVEKNDQALAEYYTEKDKHTAAVDLNPAIVPNQYRTYLIMLGVFLGIVFLPLYRHLNDYHGLLTPKLVVSMFAPLFILLTFITVEMAVIRSRILWQSLKPQQDLNFSMQAMILLLAPIGVVLYLVMQGWSRISMNGQTLYMSASLLQEHATFWICWGIFYLLVLINIIRQSSSEEHNPQLQAQRLEQIKEMEHRLKAGRQAYRAGSASLYTLAGICATCSFLLYIKLPLSTPNSLFWALQFAFTAIPLSAVFFYGVNVRIPLSTLLSIANSRAQKVYTVSVFFAAATAVTLCLFQAAEQIRDPLYQFFNPSTVMSTPALETKNRS